MRARLAAVAAAAVLLTACGEDPGGHEVQGEQESCGAAVDAVAVAVRESDGDATEHLAPAFEACADLTEFSEAAEDNPDILSGSDPETFVRDACAETPDLAGTTLCEAAAEE